MEAEQNQLPVKRAALLTPWLRPVEKALIYLGAFVFAFAVISLSFPSEWHQTYWIAQWIAVGYSLLAGIILCVRGYDEQRVGNKEREHELIGLGGLYIIFFALMTQFGGILWLLWIRSVMEVIVLVMTIRARQMYERKDILQ
jgi:hypothetical protein